MAGHVLLFGATGYTGHLVLAALLDCGQHPLRASAAKALRRTGEGPDAAARAKSGTLVVAVAYDLQGKELVTVRFEGDNGYDVTTRVLAKAACRLAAGELPGTGALGPVDAYGLDELARVHLRRTAGLRRV